MAHADFLYWWKYGPHPWAGKGIGSLIFMTKTRTVFELDRYQVKNTLQYSKFLNILLYLNMAQNVFPVLKSYGKISTYCMQAGWLLKVWALFLLLLKAQTLAQILLVFTLCFFRLLQPKQGYPSPSSWLLILDCVSEVTVCTVIHCSKSPTDPRNWDEFIQKWSK